MKAVISRCLALLCLAMAFAHTPALAEGDGWRITQVEGVVRVSQPGAPPRDARHGQDLGIGTVITTGRNSSATIDNGLQTITISASSRTTLAPESRPGRTSIFQGVGTALFKVDRRRDQHFEVNTPLLAAVVKGTTFTVTAGPQDDVVHVSSGLVEVRPLAGAERIDVAPGQTVRVNRMAPEQMSLATPASDAALPAGVAVPSVDYVTVSNNLFVPPVALSGNGGAAGTSAAGGNGAGNGNGNSAGLSGAQPQNPAAQAATSAVLVSAVNALNSNGNGNGHHPAPASAPVAAAPAPAPTPAAASAPTGNMAEIVRGLIADKTGYPPEMLEDDMDLEGELGVDSIKQVEILSALREQMPNLPEVDPEQIAELRSIRKIADFFG